MTLTAIIFAGILTYFTRMTMIVLIDRDMLGDKIKAVLEYVPSAVFPAIIFPAIFINDYGSFVPEELGLKFAIPLTFIAIVVQDLKKLDHVIVMITCGLSSLLFFDAPFKSYIIISPIIALFVAALLLRLKK